MPTLLDSLVSSSARKMPIRKRGDLSSRKQHYLGRTYWVVKDPVGLNYFRFQEEEYAILQMLDGETSLDEIKDRFEKQFPPQKITLEELHQFLGMLHKSGLILTGSTGQARELLKRRSERNRQKLVAALANILCLRFKGFDPERFLAWLHPYVKWFFSPTSVYLAIFLMVAAGTLVMVEFDVFRSKLPDFHQFFNMKNAFWLAIVLGVTKVVHEFGHGLACKHFGGECHEMGIMILVLTPCLYCNVSDSWMLPSKWHRVYIGAAGMYVEIVLASICTFFWWFTEPGLFNHLCLNVMFVCSVSTVIFNGNPLLRYDGYYIVADILEIPNLRQKSTQIFSRKMSEWFLGMESPEDPFLPEGNQILFAIYSIASAIYRWVVVISILMFLNVVWKPYKLEIIGQILGLMSIYGLFVYPLWKVGKFFYVPGRIDKVKMPRMYASMAGVGVLLAAFLFLPLPFSVISTLEVQPRDATAVYVEIPGTLQEVYVQPGDHVKAGQPLAQLYNIDLQIEHNRLTTSRDLYGIQLEDRRRRQANDSQVSSEIPQLIEALTTYSQQVQQKEYDLKRLRLTAAVDGTVMPPTYLTRKDNPDLTLPTWSGTPLEKHNLGAYMEAASLFCYIGDPKKMEAVLVIDQEDLPFVRANQRVEIKLDELPHDRFEGVVGSIAEDALKVTPHRLTAKAGGELASRMDTQSGVERPMTPSYQARVALDDEQGLLRIGVRGRAKIHCDWQPLAQRAWRFLTHTFNFRM